MRPRGSANATWRGRGGWVGVGRGGSETANEGRGRRGRTSGSAGRRSSVARAIKKATGVPPASVVSVAATTPLAPAVVPVPVIAPVGARGRHRAPTVSWTNRARGSIVRRDRTRARYLYDVSRAGPRRARVVARAAHFFAPVQVFTAAWRSSLLRRVVHLSNPSPRRVRALLHSSSSSRRPWRGTPRPQRPRASSGGARSRSWPPRGPTSTTVRDGDALARVVKQKTFVTMVNGERAFRAAFGARSLRTGLSLSDDRSTRRGRPSPRRRRTPRARVRRRRSSPTRPPSTMVMMTRREVLQTWRTTWTRRSASPGSCGWRRRRRKACGSGPRTPLGST